MVAHEFSISAQDLDASGKRVRFRVRASWIRGTLEGTDVQQGGPDGEFDARLSRSGKDVVVRGTLTAELSVACARCLQPARIRVVEPISALMVPASELSGSSEADEHEQGAGQADVIAYDGETVVLDELVRDELVLSVPMIPLCSESCAGIRPETLLESAPPAIDPRLSPLLRLKKSST